MLGLTVSDVVGALGKAVASVVAVFAELVSLLEPENNDFQVSELSFLLLGHSFLLYWLSFLLLCVSFPGQFFPFFCACVYHLTFLLLALTCEVEKPKSSFSQKFKFVLSAALPWSSPLVPPYFLKNTQSKINIFNID